MRIARVLVLCLLPSFAAAQPVQPVQVLHEFATSPSGPSGRLLQVPDGSFYGVTSDAIYRVATNGSVTIAARLTDGVGADGALVRGPDGALYGTAQWGGTTGQGTVFRFDPSSGAVATLHTFTGVHEGTSPFDGLTLAGGLLYGVTNTTLFRVDPVSGATTILYTFGEGTSQILSPSSGLTVGADGLLYGTTSSGPGTARGGTIYRLDPATNAVAVVHAFTDLIGPEGRLLLGPDGRLFGSTIFEEADFPDLIPGGVYSYDPATDAYAVIARYQGASGFPTAPGPLVMTSDGSLYGTTSIGFGLTPESTLLCVLFRLRPTASGYAYEYVRGFGFTSTGLSERVQLTLGADGLLYGYAQQGGPVGAGTVYRLDPAAGPAPVPLTILHQFVPTTIWGPSEPMLGADGRLYGTGSHGGAGRRGGIYALDPATGGFIHAADAGGTAAGVSSNVNSALTVGPDNALYGTSVLTMSVGTESGVVRFVPTTNAVTHTLNSAAGSATDLSIVRSSTGDLYFVRDRTVFRVAPNGTATPAGTEPFPPGITDLHTKITTWSAPVVGGDGQVYVGIVTGGGGAAPFEVFQFSRIFRVNQSTNALDQVAAVGGMAGLAPAPGGLYVGSNTGVWFIDVSTGAVTPVCTWPNSQLASIAAIGDRVVGLTKGGEQRLLICQVTTGATEVRTLPATIGTLRDRLVAIGDALYGATWDQVSRHRGSPSRAPRAAGGAVVRLFLSGTPPALETDADGLPNEWETTYGLDPFDATGDNGASGDPDGDGRTNAQELADGTHPRGTLTRYFAEGATGPFFRTRIDLANADAGRSASVLVRFQTDTGARITQSVVVPAGGHDSIDPATIAGLAHTTFSTVVEADATIAVDRTMTWDASGYGSHIETGVVTPATTWYLAEGSTSGPFALFYLLQNPQATAVNATVRYLRPFGLPPIDKTYTLPPNSRTTIVVDDEGAELTSTDVSAVITAPSPIVAERAMYYSQPGQPFAAGHESAGVTAPALEWFLAEGATGTFFDLFVLIANPNASPANVEVEYLLVGGGTLTKTYTVAGNGRSTIWVDDEQLPPGSGQKPLLNAALSMTVRSTNSVPIVVERTMWWPGPALTPNFWAEAHNSPGATATATRWLVAGAEMAGPAAAQTYVLIANPGTTAGRAAISVLTTAGTTRTSFVDLPAKSRTNVPFTAPVGSSPFGVLVESIGTSPVPIVVEHATYSSPGGVLWTSGGNALASPLP